MGMDWLYGPERSDTGKEGVNLRRDYLRSMTLDAEILRDIREDIEHQAKETGGLLLGGIANVTAKYYVGSRLIPETQALALGLLDRDKIQLTILVEGSGNEVGQASLQISCAEASVMAFPIGEDMVAIFAQQMKETAIRRLIDSGSPRPSWGRVASIAVWLFPLAAVALWLWLADLVLHSVVHGSVSSQRDAESDDHALARRVASGGGCSCRTMRGS